MRQTRELRTAILELLATKPSKPLRIENELAPEDVLAGAIAHSYPNGSVRRPWKSFPGDVSRTSATCFGMSLADASPSLFVTFKAVAVDHIVEIARHA